MELNKKLGVVAPAGCDLIFLDKQESVNIRTENNRRELSHTTFKNINKTVELLLYSFNIKSLKSVVFNLRLMNSEAETLIFIISYRMKIHFIVCIIQPTCVFMS